MAATSASRSWFSPVKRGLAASAVAAVALIALAVPASAHTPEAKSDCAKNGEATLTIHLKNYNWKKTNTVEVLEGDVSVFAATKFGSEFEKVLKFDGAVAHSWIVRVKAGDDPNGTEGWTKDIPVRSDVCKQPPTSSSSSSSQPTQSSTQPPAPSSSSAAVAPTTTTTVAIGANANLAETGASIALPLGIGALLLVGGGVLLLVMRRRGRA
jgi:hypothetical protein